MPFTPFHFGPGLALKSAMPERFSLSAFMLANIAMDVEPLYRMWRVEIPLHGASHTLAGALAIGAAAALFGKLAVTAGAELLRTPMTMNWQQAVVGAFCGVCSHVLLDAVMHADLHPFAPWSQTNPLLHPEWMLQLHLGCILAGLFGMLALLIRLALHNPRIQ